VGKIETYRQWLTACLILLYGFIITPTQWWHHHEILLSASSKVAAKDPITPAWDVESGTPCKICSHHYSYHNNEDIPVLSLVKEYFSPFTSEPIGFISLPFTGNPAERGPPSLS
jgi:hypothetical protein